MNELGLFKQIESGNADKGIESADSETILLKESIPYFESLDQVSQEFSLFVARLSSCGREQFLKNNQDVAKAIKSCEDFQSAMDVEPSGLLGYIRSWRLENTSNKLMLPRYFEDKVVYLASMEELLRLHILELHDAERSKSYGQMMYSRQTEYLAEKLLERFVGMLIDTDESFNAGLPDAFTGIVGHLRDGKIPMDVQEQLILIHRLIMAQHEHFRGSENTAPAGKEIIKDLWRFCVVTVGGFHEIQPSRVGPWNAAALRFFDSLSSLSFKE